MRRTGYICVCKIAAKGYILLVSNPGKEGGGGACTGYGGATAEPVNLLLLLEDQISESTFLKETNRSNEREPIKLRASFLMKLPVAAVPRVCMNS